MDRNRNRSLPLPNSSPGDAGPSASEQHTFERSGYGPKSVHRRIVVARYREVAVVAGQTFEVSLGVCGLEHGAEVIATRQLDLVLTRVASERAVQHREQVCAIDHRQVVELQRRPHELVHRKTGAGRIGSGGVVIAHETRELT
jgi:hypothetical protein